MIFECHSCERKFETEIKPDRCPYCGKSDGFSMIRIIRKNGQEVTYGEHIEELRRYYVNHVPIGMSRKTIEMMDEKQLEELHDILSE